MRAVRRPPRPRAVRSTPLQVDLVDALELHLLHPTTFEVPSVGDIDGIRVGDLVKVAHGGERFWISVDQVGGRDLSVNGSGVIVSNLIADPRRTPLQRGVRIAFHARHVHAVELR